jgi:hypothetical protein
VSKRAIPRTSAEAKKRKFKKTARPDAADPRFKGSISFSKAQARPGDVAFIGPCEPTGTRVICFYDENMDPSDCRNVPC